MSFGSLPGRASATMHERPFEGCSSKLGWGGQERRCHELSVLKRRALGRAERTPYREDDGTFDRLSRNILASEPINLSASMSVRPFYNPHAIRADSIDSSSKTFFRSPHCTARALFPTPRDGVRRVSLRLEREAALRECCGAEALRYSRVLQILERWPRPRFAFGWRPLLAIATLRLLHHAPPPLPFGSQDAPRKARYKQAASPFASPHYTLPHQPACLFTA